MEEEFLRRKFQHLYYNFDHGKKGFIDRKDAELQIKKLLDALRRQQVEKGANEEEIQKRIKEFTENWIPGAMKYFVEMSRFSKTDPERIALEEFMAFNMSIREHIEQTGNLPAWFEDSLRLSYDKCWACEDTGHLDEDGLELLPGVCLENKSICHQWLTDNNNKKIGMVDFLGLIKDYYSVSDPQHISKFIHGYE